MLRGLVARKTLTPGSSPGQALTLSPRRGSRRRAQRCGLLLIRAWLLGVAATLALSLFYGDGEKVPLGPATLGEHEGPAPFAATQFGKRG